MFDAREHLRLRDMHQRCERILAFTARLTRDVFFDTPVCYDAAMWNLMIIGEAANHVPSEITEAHPDIPWRELTGLRNRLAHEYNALDDDTIWIAVSVGVPKLLVQLNGILDDLTTEDADG